MIELTNNPDINANEYVIAKNMADTLNRHYPGHAWAVTCEYGIATVRNLRLDGNWGFVLKLSQLLVNPEKTVMRAGGELLERYKLSRGKFKSDEYENLDFDRLGRLAADA